MFLYFILGKYQENRFGTSKNVIMLPSKLQQAFWFFSTHICANDSVNYQKPQLLVHSITFSREKLLCESSNSLPMSCYSHYFALTATQNIHMHRVKAR